MVQYISIYVRDFHVDGPFFQTVVKMRKRPNYYEDKSFLLKLVKI